jgi:hypothetical protein
MKLRIQLGLTTTVVLALLAGLILRRPIRPLAAAALPSMEGLQAINLVFGEKDSQPTKWDGTATLSGGTIERIAGYHFTKQSKLVGDSGWEASSHPWPAFAHEMWPAERPQPRATQLETIGVTIYYRAPETVTMKVDFADGQGFSFRLADVPPVGSIYPYNARVEVRRSPVVQQVTSVDTEDDYSSIAVDSGTVWTAWQSYRTGGDRVYLRAYKGGQWGEPMDVAEKQADIFGTGVAASGGQATVVWSEHEGEDWHLQARHFDGANFGPIEDVTSGTGKSLFHRVAADSKGGVHVAYQKWANGRSNIYLRSRTNNKWAAEIPISDPARDARANDWDAAVAAGKDGSVWVAWDSYATGNYEVYMRRVADGKAQPIIRVTSSTRFHAHPSLAVDAQNRVWIAYDEAPENWGKDLGFLFSGGTGLYDSRTIRVATYAGGKWMTPYRQPEEVMPWGFKRFVHTPRLAVGSDGRIWLVFRPRVEARFPTNNWQAGGKWEVLATYYSGDRWSDLIYLPNSVGRNGGELDAAPDSQGNVWVALVTDNKFYGGPEFGEQPGNNDVIVARVKGGPAPNAPQLAERSPEPPAGLPNEPEERRDISNLRNYSIQDAGKTYKIFRGDLHRHTEISLDGAGDGTLWDAYRYALDAAGLDFLVVTDHQSGDQEYTWWRIEKASDMFHVPGFFTAVYGTERSVNYPNGHRNLLYPKRGVPVLAISPEERQGKSNSGSWLYPFLKKWNGIATPHSSHTGMGTDWRDNDPEVDPIVEIWEGSRTSAEAEGAPLAPSSKRTEWQAGGFKPLGFVWNAWAKGYKLGVQASSDHASTHLSYTMVISENGTREALIDAMKKRHTFAATRNILLDYRMNVDGKTYIQGDELTAAAMPEIRAHIQGAGPLKTVVIVRDNQYIYTIDPKGMSFDLAYRERSLSPGKHFYYVRLEQQDRNMAWSSPIWINYSPR